MTDVARLFGSVEATWSSGGEVLGADLAMCVEKLADAVDGWDLALASLEAETRGARPGEGAGADVGTGFAAHARPWAARSPRCTTALRTAFGTSTQAGHDGRRDDDAAARPGGRRRARAAAVRRRPARRGSPR